MPSHLSLFGEWLNSYRCTYSCHRTGSEAFLRVEENSTLKSKFHFFVLNARLDISVVDFLDSWTIFYVAAVMQQGNPEDIFKSFEEMFGEQIFGGGGRRSARRSVL